jgi:hypothetical protein
LVQHVELPMQRLPQTLSPPGQLQLPPGPEQSSPDTGQSLLVQQLPMGMHWPFAVQNFCPVPQLHEPPGPEQV